MKLRGGGIRLSDRAYLAEATRHVFKDRTVWWRAVALSAINLVPIMGSIFSTGYLMVLMREVAWGVDQGLPRFSNVEELMKRGLSGFLVAIVLTLPVTIVAFIAIFIWAASTLPATMAGAPQPQLPWWFVAGVSLLTALLAPIVYLAYLRAGVYLKTSEGLSASGLKQLVNLDKSGFMRVARLPLCAGLLGTVLSLLTRVAAGGYGFLVYPLGFLVGLVTMPIQLTVATAYGMWARETDPASWPPVRAEQQVFASELPGQAVVGDTALLEPSGPV